MKKKNDTGGLLRIYHMLKDTEVSRRALRFYEDQGLVLPAGRDGFGRRVYMRTDLMRVRLIRFLRSGGLSIQAIREVLDARVVRPGDGPDGPWVGRVERVLGHHADELRAQLAEMQRAEAGLREGLGWLQVNHARLVSDPEGVLVDESVPLLVRAILSQPQTLATRVPRKKAKDEDDLRPSATV